MNDFNVLAKKIFVSILLVSTFALTSAQQPYFVDGYHGGVYGHYPIDITKFIVDKFHEHPEWRISLEIEPETWDSVLLRTPEDYANLQKIIYDKRIEMTNPAYSQPYFYKTSGESMIRQFQYGLRKTREHFPDLQFTTYAVQEPCFTSSLPQILKLFGVKYAVLKNPGTCWGGYTAAYGGELVNWTGPDSTSILTVPRYAGEALEENSTWQTAAWNNSRAFIEYGYDYGIKNPVGNVYQDAGWRGGPWLGHGNNIKNGSIYVTWTEYIENVTSMKTDDDWHFTQEDILVSLVWGSQALQRIARQVRRGENDIVMAEKMSVISNIESGFAPSQKNIDEAWRTLMMAQHHDSWIVPYNRLFRPRTTWVQQVEVWTDTTSNLARKIIRDAKQSFGSETNPRFIRVYITCAINRKEIIKVELGSEFAGKNFEVYDSDNKIVPSWTNDDGSLFFNAHVASFGFTTYRFAETNTGQRIVDNRVIFNDNECTIENDMYKIVFDASKGGIIKSLIAKQEGNREFVATNSQYSLSELRGHFFEEERFHSSTDAPARITVLEDNQFRTTVKIEGSIASHPFTQIVSISQGQRIIDFDLTIDWKESPGIGEYRQLSDDWRENRSRAFYDSRYKLSVLFPVNLDAPKLFKNAPFDVCESRHENTFFNRWDSIKHNIILNWVDLLESNEQYGFALLSDHTTSYSFGGDFPLGLTAQYSGVGLWGVNYRITQPLHIKYAIAPHKGKWNQAAISTESAGWNEPLIYSLHNNIEPNAKSLIDAANTGYEITAAVLDEHDIILRLFNAEGDNTPQNVVINFPFSRIDEINLDGKILVSNVAQDNRIAVVMPRFGIKTFKISR